MATIKLNEIKRVVILYRLSKPKKGKTKDMTKEMALGLAAQKQYVHNVLAPYNPEIIDQITEIESATRRQKFQLSKRPDLRRALQLCQMHDATLVISTADRLVRNSAFGNWLMEEKVAFFCCDDPEMNHLSLRIKFTMAQEEGERISQRVKAALGVLKERGVKLGAARPGHFHNGKLGPDGEWIPSNMHKRGSLQGCKVMAENRVERARERYKPLFSELREMLRGKLVLREICEKLNDRKMRTTAFKRFTEPTVHRIINRYRSEIMRANTDG